MEDYGRRIVVDLPFERALFETSHALRHEGLDIIWTLDVRDHVKWTLRQNLRQYVLLHACSAEVTAEALRHDLAAGTVLTTAIAIYELADGETAIVAAKPFAQLADDAAWRAKEPALARLADGEIARVARVLETLEHVAPHSHEWAA